MARVLAPPRERQVGPNELDALIREARARQRRRQALLAAGIALVAAAALAASAAIGAGGAARHTATGGGDVTASRGTAAGRRQVQRMGSSGGVTWALNASGIWLTTSGGRTWRAATPRRLRGLGQIDQRIQQVQFLDRRDGWLSVVDSWSGSGSYELDWTHDGGRTWQRLKPAGCCGLISFLTPLSGFMSGQSLRATNDGGATWRVVSQPPFPIRALTFLDARHGLAFPSSSPGLFRTTDGGRHWVHVLGPGASTVLLPPVTVFGRRLVVPAERPAAQPPGLVVYVSGDAGSTWTVRPLPRWWVPSLTGGGPFVLGDEQRFSAATASVWFAAAGRKLAVTTDAGRTWRSIRPVGVPVRWSIGAIDFTSAGAGWAIFNGPRQSVLVHTTDGGMHWTPAGPQR